MNVELIPSKQLQEAQALIEQGGNKVAEGIAMILIAKADYSESSDGENCADKLNGAIRLLKEDPYLAIGVEDGEKATESDIKKGYRKFALKYHPDKTLNKTGLLFTVIQTAYDILSDEEKRKAFDARVKRHKLKLEKMRAAKEEKEKRKADAKSAGLSGNLKTPSGNSFRQPPQSKDEASYRAFNKNFFNEFRKTHAPPPKSSHHTPPKDKPPPPSHSSAHDTKDSKSSKASNGLDGDVAQVTRLLKLKATHRSDTTVTLSWATVGENSHSTAFELQWRMHGKGHEWETSAQLILGNSCRKKNLSAETCYAFRIRAASSTGWSKYCESVLVVTNNNHSRPSSASKHRSDKHPDKRTANKQPSTNDQDNNSGNSSGKDEGGHKKKAPPPQDMFKQNFSSDDAWICTVCKRPNSPDILQCSICYTKRSYVGKKTNNGTRSSPYPNTARASSENKKTGADRGYQSEGVRRGAAADDDSEEEYEEAWKFDESDAANSVCSFEIGDVVMTNGLSTKEYNGLMGEIRSILTEGRHQVSLTMKDNTSKDLRMKPENLMLKRRKRTKSNIGNKDNIHKSKEAFKDNVNGSNNNNGGVSKGSGEDVSGGDLGGREYRSGFPKIFYLNKVFTKLHNVRLEPILESKIVGSLLPDKQVLATAEVGDWLKVEWHVKNDDKKNTNSSKNSRNDVSSFGWCLYKDGNKRFLTMEECDSNESARGDGRSSKHSYEYQQGDQVEEVIYELRDATGDLYYFNGYTGVSCWDPPEWIDSIDPVSQACYYENTVTGETQWETPFDFIPVVREEAYSTPEAEFIKSVLSPKRSRGAGKFYTPDEA